MKNHKCRVAGTMIAVALVAIQSLAQSTYEPYTFTTLAGGGGYSTNGAGSAAQFNQLSDVAVDSAGNLYVADSGNSNRQLTLVGTNWVLRTLAGLAGSFASANGTNSDARFDIPFGVTVDRADNLFVADLADSIIRKMTLAETNWVVTTLAGTGGAGRISPLQNNLGLLHPNPALVDVERIGSPH